MNLPTLTATPLGTPLAAPIAAGLAALAARLAADRWQLPALRFAAGGGALALGWTLIGGLSLTAGNLAAYALLATLTCALLTRTPPRPTPSRRAAAPSPALTLNRVLPLLLAALGAGWLPRTATPELIPLAATATCIATASLLATDAWAIAAAATALAAALAAIGAPPHATATATVVLAATLAATPLPPLAAALGAVTAAPWAVPLTTISIHHAIRPLAFTPLAPLAALLLTRLWQHRFTRLRTAAAPIRALTAAALVSATAFAAAAMAGLR